MTSYKEPLKIIITMSPKELRDLALSPDPDDDEQTPPAASQEAADPDKEDAQ